MSWQDLLCASCSGRVAEARCPVCRAARERFTTQSALPAGPLLALAALLLLVVVLLQLA